LIFEKLKVILEKFFGVYREIFGAFFGGINISEMKP